MKLILLFALLGSTSHANKPEVHRQEFRAIVADTDKYEKRMDVLRRLKNEEVEGPNLDAIISEIADLHKKLLDLKGRKNKLTEHMRAEHPTDELVLEISKERVKTLDKEAKKAGVLPEKKSAKSEDLDMRLNRLLVQIESQYARTAKDREELAQKSQRDDGTMVINVGPTAKKKREIRQEDKDKYLKEALKAKMKLPEKTEGEEANGEAGEAPAGKDPAHAEPAHH